MREVGIDISLWLNLYTTTVFNQVLEWRLTRLYMEENVEHRCVGRNLVKEK